MVQKLKVRDLAQYYFGSVKWSTLSINTKIAYESAWRSVKFNRLSSIIFQEMDARLVTPLIVEQVKDSIFFNRGPAAAKITFSLLNNIWKFGARLELVSSNPWVCPDLPASKKRNTMWDHRQITRFVHLARQLTFKDLALVFLLCYETGQRPVDILSLKLSSVDRNKISFYQQKTAVPVTFLVPPFLNVVLDRQLTLAKKLSMNGWLFPDGNGGHRSYDWFAKKVELIKKQDTIFEGLQIRDLRRTAITETLNAGATDWETQNFSGHKNIASMKPYKVPSNAQTQNAQEKRWAARSKDLYNFEEQTDPAV